MRELSPIPSSATTNDKQIRSVAARNFCIWVAIAWVLLIAGCTFYARINKIPAHAAVPLAVALVIELPFYLLPAFGPVRAWVAERGRAVFALLLIASSVAPWLTYSVPLDEFGLLRFLGLLAIVSVVSLWYVVLPRHPLADLGFLAILAGVVAGKIFTGIYLSPLPKLNLSVLGHAMLIRTGALAVLQVRGFARDEGVPDYRFWPRRSDWLIGFRYFACLLPVVGIVYWLLGLADLRAHPLKVWQAAGTFLGILWFTALSEEFFFRGLLQQWVELWSGRAAVALLVASLLFGSVHLGMHNQFPNWRFALVASVAGAFYGLAWRTNRSIQASMVAHALTVTVWKTFLH